MADKNYPTDHIHSSLENNPRKHSEILKTRHLNLNQLFKDHFEAVEKEE